MYANWRKKYKNPVKKKHVEAGLRLAEEAREDPYLAVKSRKKNYPEEISMKRKI